MAIGAFELSRIGTPGTAAALLGRPSLVGIAPLEPIDARATAAVIAER